MRQSKLPFRRIACAHRCLAAGFIVLAIQSQLAAATPYSDFSAGLASMKWNHCEVAISFFTSALSNSSFQATFRPVALAARAICFAKEAKYDNALSDLNASLIVRPNDFETLLIRADVHTKRKEFAAAQLDYTAAITSRPERYEGYRGLSALDAQKCDFDADVALHLQYMKAAPHSLDPFFGIITAYELKGDLSSALDYADQLVSRAPKAARALGARAEVKERQHDFDDALDDIESALSLDEEDANYLGEKGTLQWEMKKFGDAIQTFSHLNELEPQNAYASIWLHLARTGAGEPDGDFQSRDVPLDEAKWPAPVIGLFEGKISPDDLLQSVADNDERISEAHFYIGEWFLEHDDKSGARSALSQANEVCSATGYAHFLAQIELARLK